MGELKGDSTTVSTDAIIGTNAIPNGKAAGVHGVSKNAGPGVLGESVDGRGVQGMSTNNYGIRAHSDQFPGLRASSAVGRAIEGWGVKDDGVWGVSKEATGVHGVSENTGTGVIGESKIGRGVHGISETWQGVFGQSRDNAGIVGESETFHAIFGVSHSVNNGGVIGINVDHSDAEQGFGVIGRGRIGISGESNAGIGVFGKGALAARFEGDVEVTGDIRLTNKDFAEDFDVVIESEPGEVMVLTESGMLEPSSKAYDKKVVGVLSGAGTYKPGIILDKQNNNSNRKPIAMMGKVYCKVDADSSPIATGDMLTTSTVSGYAMKAIDPFQAFGAVIGKALASLSKGKGLIPILVTLQ
jgi:hypothetical protein